MQNRRWRRMFMDKSVRPDVPQSVIDSLSVNAPVQQIPLPGSWGGRHAVRVSNSQTDIVVKYWSGLQEEARGRAEADLLARLSEKKFRHAPQAVRIGDNFVLPATEGIWTAQQHVWGKHLRYEVVHDAAFHDRLGRAIGSLHRESCAMRAGLSESRLLELNELPDLAAGEGLPVWPVVQRACSVATPHLTDVLDLPRATLHGDCNLENLINTPRDLVMIDFEYTRNDVRLLDLASLCAPVRDASGRLQLAPDGFQSSVAHAYMNEVGSSVPVHHAELRLLPVVSLMHFLLILGDQLRAGSPNISHVLPLIEPLTDMASTGLQMRRQSMASD